MTTEHHDEDQLISGILKTYREATIPPSVYTEDMCPHCGLGNQPIIDIENNKICSICYVQINADDNTPKNLDECGAEFSRCGNMVNPYLIESSYATTFGPSKNPYFRRLKQLAQWQSIPCHERSIREIFNRIAYIGNDVGLYPAIIEYAQHLYYLVYQNRQKSRGSKLDGLISACLSYACKEYDYSRSPQEIARMCGIGKNIVTQGISTLKDLLRTSDEDTTSLINKPSECGNFIQRYGPQLGLSSNEITLTLELAKWISDHRILTKPTTQTISGVCLYFTISTLDLSISWTQIHQVVGVTPTTIKKSYECILPYTPGIIEDIYL